MYLLNGKNVYHTGSDLNLPGNDDKLKPLSSIFDCVVIFSGLLPSTWADVIITKQEIDGVIIYARYAHVDEPLVAAGQQVLQGQMIGRVGNANGQLSHHLHFDICLTDILETIPGHWPGGDLVKLKQNYVEPCGLILASQNGFTNILKTVKSNANFRAGPSTSFRIYELLLPGRQVTVLGEVEDYSLVKVDNAFGFVYTPLLDNPPTPAGVDMAKYFFPTSGNYGNILTLVNNWGEGPERQQLQRDGNISYVTKNELFEKRIIETDGIYFVLDTSPGNNQFYTIEGTAWLPRFWNPGDEFARVEKVKYYDKDTCQLLSTHEWQTKLRFFKLHNSMVSPGGVPFSDVSEIQWLVNNQIEETYFLAPGEGLAEWKNKAGKHSWSTERIPVGQQGNNVMKPIDCLD